MISKLSEPQLQSPILEPAVKVVRLFHYSYTGLNKLWHNLRRSGELDWLSVGTERVKLLICDSGKSKIIPSHNSIALPYLKRCTYIKGRCFVDVWISNRFMKHVLALPITEVQWYGTSTWWCNRNMRWNNLPFLNGTATYNKLKYWKWVPWSPPILQYLRRYSL